MGVILKEKRDLEGACSYFKRATDLDPDYAEAYFNIGVLQLHLKNVDAAVKSFNSAIDIDRDYAKAHINLGVAF